MMHDEQCWVLMGRKRPWYWYGKYDRYTVGQPARVAFDPDYVWDNRDRIVGWIHTHPSWVAKPSQTDHTTMCAQVTAIGRPLVCCILGTDGLKAWWYFNDEDGGVEGKVCRAGKLLVGVMPSRSAEAYYPATDDYEEAEFGADKPVLRKNNG